MYPKGRSHLVTLSTELRGEICLLGRRERSDVFETDTWRMMAGKWHVLVSTMSSTTWESFLAHIERASEFPEAAMKQGGKPLTTALSQARWLRDQPYAH